MSEFEESKIAMKTETPRNASSSATLILWTGLRSRRRHQNENVNLIKIAWHLQKQQPSFCQRAREIRDDEKIMKSIKVKRREFLALCDYDRIINLSINEVSDIWWSRRWYLTNNFWQARQQRICYLIFLLQLERCDLLQATGNWMRCSKSFIHCRVNIASSRKRKAETRDRLGEKFAVKVANRNCHLQLIKLFDLWRSKFIGFRAARYNQDYCSLWRFNLGVDCISIIDILNQAFIMRV